MGRDVHSHLTHAEMQQAGRALQDIYPRMDTHVCGLGDAWADGMFGTSASINVLYGNRLLASNAGVV